MSDDVAFFGLRLGPQIAEAGEREQAMVHPHRA